MPFIAVEMHEITTEHGGALQIRTNVDDEIIVDRDHRSDLKKAMPTGLCPMSACAAAFGLA